MGTVKLFHPITEEKAAEFVDATSVDDLTDEEKSARVSALVASAAENQQWRHSRDPNEQLALANVPFTEAPDKDDPAAKGDPDEA